MSLTVGQAAHAQAFTPISQRLTDWWWKPAGTTAFGLPNDTSGWRPASWCITVLDDQRSPARQMWLRTRVTISESHRRSHAMLVLRGWSTASEVYWDGELLNRNGWLGPQGEQPGSWHQQLALSPARAQAGTHTLLVRVSNEQFAERPWQPTAVLTTGALHLAQQQAAGSSAMLIIGMLVASALFCGLLYVGFARQRSYLSLIVYCGLHALIIYAGLLGAARDASPAEYFLFVHDVSYLALLANNLCLLTYLVLEFRLPQGRWWLAGTLAFSVAAYGWLPVNPHFVVFTVVLVAAGLVAVRLRPEASGWALAGIVAMAGLTFMGYLRLLPLAYYWGIVCFIGIMAISIGRQLVQRYREQQEAQLRSVRLENELLRKNIQPHFLFNTLMSLQELIEENPKQANQLIDALAAEFELVSSIAEEKLISIEEELQICRTHLRIMGFRRQSEFVLETRGLLGTEQVPPATFQTLIENGLTHGYAQRGTGRFVLTKEPLVRGVRYRLFNDSDAAACSRPVVEGTGSRYVKMRLEESFPGAWHLRSAPVNGGWAVEIDLLEPSR
ncbi:histidine kinase [Hymenobacter sp. BT175]|uniref:histidine kinase n=1 Tax=Hymenobacter translucens TaxID=2886507 RepID=UPI001D0E40C8|nr:sensor histidine kinase [Hymenobacter translucens]MCC2548608.1 histidine kinase [Hymenobacter translucens]